MLLQANAPAPDFQVLVVVVLILGGIFLYILPAIVASARKHHNTNAICVLNLLLGWTFLGWVISLVWALTETRTRDAR